MLKITEFRNFGSNIKVLCLTGERVLTKAVIHRCPSKKVFLQFRNVHRKTPVLESIFKNGFLFKKDF